MMQNIPVIILLKCLVITASSITEQLKMQDIGGDWDCLVILMGMELFFFFFFKTKFWPEKENF